MKTLVAVPSTSREHSGAPNGRDDTASKMRVNTVANVASKSWHSLLGVNGSSWPKLSCPARP